MKKILWLLLVIPISLLGCSKSDEFGRDDQYFRGFYDGVIHCQIEAERCGAAEFGPDFGFRFVSAFDLDRALRPYR